MKKVILDTNFFILISNKNIDIFKEIRELIMGEYILIVTSKIVNELQTLSKNNKDAKFGFNILKTKIKTGEISILENTQHPDDFIPIFSKVNEVVLCTNDSNLRKKAKKSGAKVISLKANKRLDFA